MKYMYVLSSLSFLTICLASSMEKSAQIVVASNQVKEGVHSKGDGYKTSAQARLTRSTSETIVRRCHEQKDVIDGLKALSKVTADGRDKSGEFLEIDLIDMDTGSAHANNDTTIPNILKKNLVKKISESPLRNGTTHLQDEPVEKVRRNTISG